MVLRLLADAGRDDLLEPAQLLVSEVVTNALVHSATPIEVSMAADEQGVLVEIGDGSPNIPRVRDYAPTASTGRGLALLDRTADAWGVVPGIRGKTVWFQLSSADDEPAPENGHGRHGPDADVIPLRPLHGAIEVELLNVPLLLHAAWQQHAEAVLREHLMAHMEAEPDDDPLSVHARATDALAVLAEHIPAPDVGVDPDELMSSAVDPGVSSPQVRMQVPRGSVPNFRVLDSTMESAQDMGRRGELLVPGVQPELRMMRSWLCAQVLEQAAGAEPQGWPPADALTPPERRELAWDPTVVRESAQPMIAADDTDLIVAVSSSAVELLGYEHADALLGQRLISIIPRRYRQAHLAGFTLHLLTGRAPLLRRPVKVPALRRDDTETVIELSVEAQHVEHGRSVFIATMREPTQHRQ
jgi:PAS domain S-box-containing protein